MKYFLDTAEQSEIDHWLVHVDGVTTNPGLLERAGVDEFDFFRRNQGNFSNIFIQVRDTDGHVVTSTNKIIYKIPLIKTVLYDGYKILKVLTQSNIRTCATFVYTLQQFDYACSLGTEYSIALHHKNNDDGFVWKCCELRDKMGYETKIIAASFRSAQEVNDCIRAGVDHCTVPPAVMHTLFTNDQTLQDWNITYGEIEI
jgi:transaldolase